MTGRQNKSTASGTQAWVQRWLSPARLAPYLEACGGDAEFALELHEWNLELGRVILGDIARLEIALRNVYSRVLREDCGEDWLFSEKSPVRRPIIRTSKAKKKRDVNLVNRRAIADSAGRAHNQDDVNQVIAGLMLGFWTHLTDRSRERDLWIPHLHKAWPEGFDRADLSRRLLAVNALRNRIAHNERLFDPKDEVLSPKAVDFDTISLFSSLCPEAHERFYGKLAGKSSVEAFLEERPALVDVRL